MWSASFAACQPKTVHLIDFVVYSTPSSLIQGKWYYRAETVLTDTGTALSTRLTLHLSPLPASPQSWKHRKNARSPRWECLSTHTEGIESSLRVGGGGYWWGGQIRRSTEQQLLTFAWRCRKEDISQCESTLKESGLSTSWPTAHTLQSKSLTNCSVFVQGLTGGQS